MAVHFECKRKSVEAVIESLQCFKCKDVPGFKEEQKNRYNCVNESHQLCEKCKEKCDCGSLVAKRPNPIVLKMLKDLLVYCQNYKTGCREIFAKAEDLEDHQEGCVFRLVFCPNLLCQMRNELLIPNVVFRDMVDHIIKEHNNKPIVSMESNISRNLNFTFSVNEDKTIGLQGWFGVLVLDSNTDFYLAGKNVDSNLIFCLYVDGSPLEAKKYAYTMSVIGKNGNKFTYYDNVKPLDKAIKSIISEGSLFKIGTEVIEQIVDEKSRWPIEVTIHDLKEMAKDDDMESGVEDESD